MTFRHVGPIVEWLEVTSRDPMLSLTIAIICESRLALATPAFVPMSN